MATVDPPAPAPDRRRRILTAAIAVAVRRERVQSAVAVALLEGLPPTSGPRPVTRHPVYLRRWGLPTLQMVAQMIGCSSILLGRVLRGLEWAHAGGPLDLATMALAAWPPALSWWAQHGGDVNGYDRDMLTDAAADALRRLAERAASHGYAAALAVAPTLETPAGTLRSRDRLTSAPLTAFTATLRQGVPGAPATCVVWCHSRTAAPRLARRHLEALTGYYPILADIVVHGCARQPPAPPDPFLYAAGTCHVSPSTTPLAPDAATGPRISRNRSAWATIGTAEPPT